MTIPVTRIFASASGSITFQPRFINWSYLKRGIDQRTQIKKNRIGISYAAKTLNWAIASIGEPVGKASFSYKKGTSQPPKKRRTIIADAVTIFAYSAKKNRPNFIPEYSVW